MNSRMALRWGLLLISLTMFLMAMVLPDNTPENTCLGVEILTEAEMAAFTRYQYKDYSKELTFRGQRVALDQETSTVYLSQKIDGSDSAAALQGTLELDIPRVRLFFGPDEQWNDLSGAAARGHQFRLLVSGWNDTYMEYHVVFTTLPVLSMQSNALRYDEEKWEVWSGYLTLWDPEFRDERRAGVQTSFAQWNLRGGITREMPKKALKLNLTDWTGGNYREDLLALGKDDDWILNPMSMEDSNVREMLFMKLWNEMAQKTDYNYPMSRGDYVEVILDGEYVGLYLLQRRIDDNYLKLPETSVVVKAKELGNTIEYEMRSGSNRTISDDLRRGFFVEQDCRNVSKENFVDVNLFLNLFSAMDNSGDLKNMYYVFDEKEEGTMITMIPWDTDVSLGAVFLDFFRYDYDFSMRLWVVRREWDSMQDLHPDLMEVSRQRWAALREDVLKEDHIFSVLDDLRQQVEASGAAVRDEEKWGLCYQGQDTLSQMRRYIAQRLALLDRGYAS